MPIPRFVREFDGWIYDRKDRGYLALAPKNLTPYPHKHSELSEEYRPPQHYEGEVLFIELSPGREVIIPPEELEDYFKGDKPKMLIENFR